MIREEVREEADIIRLSGGEIPEVAFWNSVHHLTSAADGPGLVLCAAEERLLKRAVVDRYLEIIRRDLTVENVGRPFYRGLVRARVNWARLEGFVRREGFSLEAVRLVVVERLRAFLLEAASRAVPLDLGPAEIAAFLRELRFPTAIAPPPEGEA